MATKHRVAERTGCRQGFSRRHSRGLDVGQQAETRDVTGFQVQSRGDEPFVSTAWSAFFFLFRLTPNTERHISLIHTQTHTHTHFGLPQWSDCIPICASPMCLRPVGMKDRRLRQEARSGMYSQERKRQNREALMLYVRQKPGFFHGQHDFVLTAGLI